eukprot:4660102-Amphidinium_carterae.1
MTHKLPLLHNQDIRGRATLFGSDSARSMPSGVQVAHIELATHIRRGISCSLALSEAHLAPSCCCGSARCVSN